MQRPSRRLVAAGVTLGAVLVAAPAAGAAAFDPTFGTNGLAVTPIAPLTSDRYQATAAAPDGGTYNVGYTTLTGTNRAFAISKVTAAGVLDPAFGTGGVAVVDVAAGPFLPGPPPPSPVGAPAQAGPTGSGETAKAVGVQADGKIVVVGQAETIQNGSKPDSRDTDVYALRLTTDGQLDATFGGAGITRIDLSDGVGQYAADATTTAVNGDQSAYGKVHIRPDGKIVFGAAKGVDADEPTRLDRDIAAVQLTAAGALDATFGAGNGVGVSPQAAINENLRMTLLDGDKLVVAAYANVAGANRPYIYRFNGNGTVDATFAAAGATPGIATAQVAGPAPGAAEAYGVDLHQGKYVVSGYGVRSTTPEFGTDAIIYRFNLDGTWDQTFGVNGLASYNRRSGAAAHFADRARNLIVVPDGRIVTVGQSGPDVLFTVLNADGSFDTSSSPDGGFVIDLGGADDALWGVTATTATTIVGAGFKATAATPAADDSALVKLDLLATPPPVNPGTDGGGGGGGTTTPVTTPEAAPDPAPSAPSTSPAPVVATPVTTTPKATTPGRVAIRCAVTRSGRARCTVTQGNAAVGTARISLKRVGAKKARAVTGRTTSRASGKSVIGLRSLPKGRYVATLQLPTAAGSTATITRTITVR